MRRTRLTVALTIALASALTLGGIALATSQMGVTPTAIASGTLGPVNLNVKTGPWMTHLRTKGDSTVAVVENRVAPGGTFGWHSHPGPSLIIVKTGTITFYHADDPTCSPHEYSAGDALVDTGNQIHVGRNEGTDEVVVIVTRFTPVGATPRIDHAAPGNCGF